MHFSLAGVVTCALTCLLTSSLVEAAPIDGCRPEFFEQLPLRTQKMCTKILALKEVQRAMEDYLEDELQGQIGFSDNGAKRQDMDHVFLRFGRAAV
ncbi:myosuppressin-like [Pollicipes pollicipes]|uniref:myosuppressin-like n=1 Tax=Pollicipes pollicipes TaxID=41117 RepID=UPI0018856BC2|nr:myosuppressin-like [Pollicipes pollicipes]